MQSAICKVADQPVPLVEGVLHGLVGQAVPGYPGHILLQPGLEIIEHRLRPLLALPGLFLRVQIPDPLLDGVELADLADGHVGLAHLRAFPLRRRRLARLDELAPRVIPAADAGETLPGTPCCSRHSRRSAGYPRSRRATARALPRCGKDRIRTAPPVGPVVRPGSATSTCPTGAPCRAP